MALHKPFDRSFFVIAGATMSNGYSLNMTKGQFGVFDMQKTSKSGLKAVSSFLGKPKTDKYVLKLGKTNLPVTRLQNNKSFSSFPFTLKDVVDLRVSAPNRTEQSLDELIVGYNGINPQTAITFEKGDRYKLTVRLEGEPIGLLGYSENGVDVHVYLDADFCPPFSGCDPCEDCDPCEAVDCLPIVLEAIERLKRQPLRGGAVVSDFIEVTPIRECTTEPTPKLIPYNFYCMDVCDTGDETALAIVQSQYPDNTVVRTKRVGATSSYQILADAADGLPTAFTTTLASVVKGCEDCPDGYTEVTGGLLYAVCLEDDGVDQSAIVETLANAVAGTATKSEGQNKGQGFYSVILSDELSDADFVTFVTANPTSVIQLVGDVDSICNPDKGDTIDWVECGTCDVIEECYTIDLPDNECGEDRLLELQQAFPSLVVELEGTKGGCQTRYKTTTKSNLVCEECDPIFLDSFITEAPESFEGRDWTVVVDANNTYEGCLCGIKLKAKDLKVCPPECLRDELGFVESSTMIRASGGYLTEVREGIGETVDEPFNVEYISKWERRTHLGGNLWDFEDRSRVFFTTEARHFGDPVARMLKGEESHIDCDTQYIDYALTLNRTHFSQSFSGKEDETITYHIFVEVGRHQEVEKILNSIATSAGISPVQAYAV